MKSGLNFSGNGNGDNGDEEEIDLDETDFLDDDDDRDAELVGVSTEPGMGKLLTLTRAKQGGTATDDDVSPVATTEDLDLLRRAVRGCIQDQGKVLRWLMANVKVLNRYSLPELRAALGLKADKREVSRLKAAVAALNAGGVSASERLERMEEHIRRRLETTVATLEAQQVPSPAPQPVARQTSVVVRLTKPPIRWTPILLCGGSAAALVAMVATIVYR